MPEYYLTDAEQKLAEIVWEQGALPSPELVRLCGERYGWKKSTVYTLLKRLEGKELFRNDGGVVSACQSRADFEAGQSRRFVEQSFSGSLPRFLAAFTRREQLSAQDAEQLRAMIRAFEAENGLTAAPDGAEGASAAPEAGTARTGEAEG